MDNLSMKDFFSWRKSSLKRCWGLWRTSRYCLHFNSCAWSNHVQAFNMSSCSCRCLFFGGGGIVFLHAIKHESFRMQTFSSVRLRSCFKVPANPNCFQPLCSCSFLALCERWRSDVDFCNPGSVYFLFPILKNWRHMHWVFVSVCDPDATQADSFKFSPLPNLRCIFLCPEFTKPPLSVSAWRISEQKKKKCTSIFVHLCNNEYLCIFLFCAIK